MKLIDIFERKVKKLSRDITLDDFAKLIADESFKEEFTSDPRKFLELVTELSNRVLDDNFRKVLNLSKFDLTMKLTEEDILQLFFSYSSGDIEREELLEKLTEKINGDDPLVSLSYALCALISVEDLVIDKTNLQKSMKTVLGYFDELVEDMAASYSVRVDLLDLLCHVRAKYFRYYQIDLLEEPEIEKLRELLRNLHSFEDEVLLSKVKEIYPESEELPEDIGLIDITKLHKNAEE